MARLGLGGGIALHCGACLCMREKTYRCGCWGMLCVTIHACSLRTAMPCVSCCNPSHAQSRTNPTYALPPGGPHHIDERGALKAIRS